MHGTRGVNGVRAQPRRTIQHPGHPFFEGLWLRQQAHDEEGFAGEIEVVPGVHENPFVLQQVECFRNAAAHLAPGGRFAIEVAIPNLRRLPPGETHVPFDLSPDHLGIDEIDVANQRLVSHHYWIADGRARTFRSEHRYVWPAELDLMAQLAGMVLEQRWSNWQREPFTSESTAHVSVWRLADRAAH